MGFSRFLFFVFPVSVFVQVLFQEIETQEEEQGVVNLTEPGDKVGKEVKGAEYVSCGYGEYDDGEKGNVSIVALPVVPDQGEEQLEITSQAAQKSHAYDVFSCHLDPSEARIPIEQLAT